MCDILELSFLRTEPFIFGSEGFRRSRKLITKSHRLTESVLRIKFYPCIFKVDIKTA